MKVEIEQANEIFIVTLAGELDGRSAPQVEEQLLPLLQPGCKFVLSLQAVTFMSSAGLRTLLLLYRRISAQSGQVVLVDLPEMVRDTMAITGFLDFFEDYETLAEGQAALNETSERE